MSDLNEIKATIRCVLLSLGKTANEREIRNAWREQEGCNFDDVLRKYRMSFVDFFHSIPDTVKVFYAHNQYFYQRISTNESTHMDKLTINKYNKSYKGPKLVTKSGNIRFETARPPLNAQTLPYREQSKNNLRPQPFQQTWSNHLYPQPNKVTSNGPINTFSSIRNVAQNTQIIRDIKPPYKRNEMEKNVHLAKDFNVTHPVKGLKSPTRSAEEEKKRDFTENNFRSLQTATDSKPSSCLFETKKNIQMVEKNESPKTFESPKTLVAQEILPTASSVMRVDKKQPDVTIPTVKKEIKDQIENVLVKKESKTDISKTTEWKGGLQINESKQKGVKSVREMEKLSENIQEGSKENEPVLSSSLKDRLNLMKVLRSAFKQQKDQQKNSNFELLSDISKVTVQLPEPTINKQQPFFEIKIIDVESPSHFTFQFSFEKLKNLTREMNHFYGNLENIEILKVNEINEGNIVALRRGPSTWCRGQIKSFNNLTAEIQYIDCQKIDTEKVSIKNLFHLHQKFTMESRKSAIGKLHGIKARKSCDLISASRLIDLLDKNVLATVKSVENDVYSLSIYIDVEKSLRLCDILIEENLVEIDPKSVTNDTKMYSLV